MVNINKYLASAGVAARRKVNEMVRAGQVSVNGQTAKLGQLINPKEDQVLVDGHKIGMPENLIYLVLNKPKGVVSTVSDEFGRKSVLDLVKVAERVYPVGRLDENTTGIILLTNDGELAPKLTHPKFEIPKTYQALVSGKPTSTQLRSLERGVMLKDGLTHPAQVELASAGNHNSVINITIHEGRNHQIRRMIAAVSLNLLALKRISFGPLLLGELKEGSCRFLSSEEIDSLKA